MAAGLDAPRARPEQRPSRFPLTKLRFCTPQKERASLNACPLLTATTPPLLLLLFAVLGARNLHHYPSSALRLGLGTPRPLMPPRLRVHASTGWPIRAPLAPRFAAPFRRSISAVTTPPTHERIHVPCRSNGSITVDVFHGSKSSPKILYLPSGPVLAGTEDEEESIVALLRETTGGTVARINYRASSAHNYPTPFHDVLYGFDWIREHLLVDEFQRPYLARLGICGELVGGSLATMLALTECRLGETRIGAAAVNNPIVDWVFPDEFPIVDPSELPEPLAPDETALPADEDMMGSHRLALETTKPRKTRKRTPKAPPQTAWQRYGDNKTLPTVTLVAERDNLFTKPDDYLDRFASPMHFFRSPHAQLTLPQHDDIFASKQPDEILDIEAQMSLDHYNSMTRQASVAPELPILSRCRAYARNYPPAGSKLSLPTWSIASGLESPLSDQATDLARVLRRSVARHALKSHAGRTRWHDKAEKQMYEEHAEEKVHHISLPGLGLWTDHTNKEWEKSIRNIGTWMKERLDTGNT